MVQPIAAAGPLSCRATADSSAAASDHFFPVRSRLTQANVDTRFERYQRR